MIQRFLLAGLCLAAVCAQGCQSNQSASLADLTDPPPPAPREFRAVWVATVANIDWPSRPGLPVDEQKREALAIIERCADLKVNAIVFQVRPGCDAMYDSKLEPWSHYLTGQQGRAPMPYYDPLKFWIDESHKRGIELHAWFNPYRARHRGAADEPLADNHVAMTRPELVREFNDWLWLDPAEPGAQDLTYDVFLDVATRYEVDAIHIDDYFYPYPDYLTFNGAVAEFPDDHLFDAYRKNGGTLSRDDWRRDNVNRLIERIYRGLKEKRKEVKFGISPFGLGRPDLRPPEIRGFSQFDKLYADADLWLHEGWLDYWTPQLYWEINRDGQAFPVLVDYWIAQNKKHRHFWPGLYTSLFAPPRRGGDDERRESATTRPTTRPARDAVRPAQRPEPTGPLARIRRATTAPATRPAAPAPRPTTAPATRPAERQSRVNPQEVVDQINLLRSRGDKANGHVHFSVKSLMINPQINDLLKDAYATPALVPASPWLDYLPPGKPFVTLTPRAAGTAMVTLRPAVGDPPRVWAIWSKYGDTWTFDVRPGQTQSFEIPTSKDGKELSKVVVTAVDRSGNESERAWAKR